MCFFFQIIFLEISWGIIYDFKLKGIAILEGVYRQSKVVFFLVALSRSRSCATSKFHYWVPQATNFFGVQKILHPGSAKNQCCATKKNPYSRFQNFHSKRSGVGTSCLNSRKLVDNFIHKKKDNSDVIPGIIYTYYWYNVYWGQLSNEKNKSTTTNRQLKNKLKKSERDIDKLEGKIGRRNNTINSKKEKIDELKEEIEKMKKGKILDLCLKEPLILTTGMACFLVLYPNTSHNSMAKIWSACFCILRHF